jgi:ribosomal protein S8E
LKPSTQTQRDQETKSKEAHAYRQKLLEEQPKKHKLEEGIMSPGYKREKETIRLKKAQKTERAIDGRNATFSECTFNMANILMVRACA